MKRRKLILIVFVISIFVFLSGCSALMEAFEDEVLRANTDVLLEAVFSGDEAAAYAVFDDYCSEADFAAAFSAMQKDLAGIEEYELKLLGANRNAGISNGVSYEYSTATYQMTTNVGRFIIWAEREAGEDMTQITIVPYEETDYYSVGDLKNLSGATALQWILLLSNLIVIALMVLAAVDCCRRKIRLKALWLVIVLIGVISAGVTYSPTSFHLNFDLGWLFSYTAFITYGGGTRVIRIALPLGAIVYLILRKHLPLKQPREAEEPAPEENRGEE